METCLSLITDRTLNYPGALDKARLIGNYQLYLVSPPGGWSGAGVGVGMLRGRGFPYLKILVSWFFGFWFLDVLFLGFSDSWFLVSRFRGFLVFVCLACCVSGLLIP